MNKINVGLSITYDTGNDTLFVVKGSGVNTLVGGKELDWNVYKYGDDKDITIVIYDYSESGILLDELLTACGVIS